MRNWNRARVQALLLILMLFVGPAGSTTALAQNSSVESTVLDADEPPPDPLDGSPESQTAITDRRMTLSVLRSVFGDGVSKISDVKNIETQRVFGLRFNGYNVDQISNFRISDAGDSAPSAGPVREGYRIKACLAIDGDWGKSGTWTSEELKKVHHDPSVTLKPHFKGSDGEWTAPTDELIRKAYGFFNPGSVPSNPQIQSLLKLKANQTPSERWQSIFLALCLDPSWQVL